MMDDGRRFPARCGAEQGGTPLIKVTPRYNEPAERLLQRFKRTCSKSGLFREIKRRRFYEKPSEKRRRLAKESLRQIQKAERRRARLSRARRRKT